MTLHGFLHLSFRVIKYFFLLLMPTFSSFFSFELRSARVFLLPFLQKEILNMILGLTSSYVDLCITDVPDPPAITVRLEGNSLRTSWDYARIPTVDVTLYWSLSFFRPSQLSNMTTTLLNTNTYNYTLQGVRSCDPFRLCARAENEVGSSSWSCNNGALPFLLQSEDITLFLVRVNEAFSLNVTVLVR